MYDPMTEPLSDIETTNPNLQNVSYCELVSIAEGMVPSDPNTRAEARRIFNDIKSPDQEGYGSDAEEEMLLELEKSIL